MKIVFENIHGNDIVYLDCLNALTGAKRNSFLDIGCNHSPFTPRLGFEQRTYIDILPRELDFQEEQQLFIQADALQFLKDTKCYDVIYSLDQIEHVTKEYGWKQISSMFRHCDRMVFFTPLDEWMMTNADDTNPESHRSIWKPDEFDNSWIKIVFPKYHPTLNIGAWFFMKAINHNTEQEFERIKNELKQKSWATELQVH